MKLDEALDQVASGGEIELERPGGRAEVEVERAGPIGARIRKIRVERDRPWSIEERARQLERSRHTPEPLEAQEIAPELGGAILRTAPDALRGDGYIEVEITERAAEVRRVRVQNGERSPGDFDLTREQLGRFLDALDG